MSQGILVSQLIDKLLVFEQEFGDVPVRVEVFKKGVDKPDFGIQGVMEDPITEGRGDDYVLIDSYGKPLPAGVTACIITLEDDIVMEEGGRVRL
jgi:hypothetical protein